jgi:hypothetical protein
LFKREVDHNSFLWRKKHSVGFAGLSEKLVRASYSIPLTREILAKLRLKAKRCKAWFRLKRDERRFMDLVISVVEKVRSFFLARILSPIIKRLLEAMGGPRDVMEAVLGKVACHMMMEGRSLAQKISRIARDWGNKSAARWPDDSGFVKYLSIMCLNKT